MLKNWTYFLLKITHEIWFTAVCYGLFGVFIATQGILFKGSLPDVELIEIGADSVESILTKFQIKSHLMVLPGRFLYPTTKVLAVTSAVTKEQEDALKGCIVVEPTRSFKQDPRFGLIVLSEVASKALSPAINDPGTAIAVLNAGTEIFRQWHENIHLKSDDKAEKFKYVSVEAVDTGSLFDDFFGPITRDGAALIEVVLRAQKILASKLGTLLKLNLIFKLIFN